MSFTEIIENPRRRSTLAALIDRLIPEDNRPGGWSGAWACTWMLNSQETWLGPATTWIESVRTLIAEPRNTMLPLPTLTTSCRTLSTRLVRERGLR